MTVDYPDYLSEQAAAALIATGNPGGPPGGTPLLHGHAHLYNNPGQVIAASGSFTPGNIVFTKPSYAIRVTCQMSGVNAAVPTVKANMQWRSSTTGTAVVDQQVWFMPAGGSVAVRTNIKGPVMADQLNITFTNGDAVDSVTVVIDIYEGTWASVRHDGRSSNGVGLAGATVINNDIPALIVANDSFSAAGAATTIKTLPLYAGQVNIWINQNVAGGSQITIVPTGDFNLGGANPIASLDWTLGPHQQISVILPRAWCTAQFTNNAAGAQIATIGITAVEFAS